LVVLVGAARTARPQTVFAAKTGIVTVEAAFPFGRRVAGGTPKSGGEISLNQRRLFRHAGVNALVQCGVLYDVTRSPRTIVNCYELR